MRKKTVFILVFFCLILIVGSVYSFRVSPVRLDLTISRGKTMEVVLTLTGSKGTGREHLLIFPTDISMERNGSLNFNRLEGFEHSAVPWIKLGEERVMLIEGQEKDLKFKISVPRSVNPGEYYAVVMVEPTEFTDVKAEDKPFMIQMKSRIAVVIVINVPGRIYEKKGEAVSANIEEIDGKINIVSTFHNLGDIHLDVGGIATIRSKDRRTSFGQVKLMATGSQKDAAFIFPGNMRDFVGVLERPLPRGEYVVDVAFDYGYKFKKARLGSSFFVARETEIDESETEFLLVDPSVIKLELPNGAFRTQIIKVVNTDYRSLNVSIISKDEWIDVSLSSFTLGPGQIKNLKVVLSISEDRKEEMIGKIIFKPDRGKSTELELSVLEPKRPKRRL